MELILPKNKTNENINKNKNVEDTYNSKEQNINTLTGNHTFPYHKKERSTPNKIHSIDMTHKRTKNQI